jgi:hypothetical protein
VRFIFKSDGAGRARALSSVLGSVAPDVRARTLSPVSHFFHTSVFARQAFELLDQLIPIT